MTDSPNVQLVRSIYAAWERGDFSSTEWAHPEIEFVIADGPDPGTFTGWAGMAEAFRALVSAEAFRLEAEEYRDLDDERVLVQSHWSGRAKRGGLEMGQIRSNGAHLFHVRGGEVTRLVFYWDRERALHDLGLSSQADSPRTAGVTSANLDLVRSIYAAWERGDYSRSAEWAHPEIHYVLTGGGPADGSWRGVAGMAEGFRTYLSAWKDFRTEAQEYRELDDERVLVLTRYSGRGKTSGLELRQTGESAATLFHLRDGAVTRLVVYATSDSAFADLGLGSEGGSL